MNTDLLIVLGLLVAAVGMFIVNKPRMDAVAVLMMVLLPFTGVITMDEALAGFADPAVVLIAALFVVGDGLVRTGIARMAGDWLFQAGGDNETKMLVLLMLVVGALGAVLSSTAVVAIFIPVVLRICQNTGTSPRQLMMPLSMAALSSGMVTLVATAPNLVVHSELQRAGTDGFGFFSITPYGLAFLFLGVGYMVFARRLLGGERTVPGAGEGAKSMRDWIVAYDLPDREHRAKVLPNSSLLGRPLAELGLREQGINILAIERPRRFGTDIARPSGSTVLEAGDVLLLDLQGEGQTIGPVANTYGLEALPLGAGGRYFTSRTQVIGMVEAVVPSESDIIGHTILQARLRSEHGLTAIGLRRGTRILSDELLTTPLKVGDTMLLFGFWSDIEKMKAHQDELVLLNLPQESADALPVPDRAPHALLALAVTIGLMVSGIVPNAQAALIGCLLMGLFGVVDMTSAYRAVSWKTVLLIVGMLPFSIALQRTGGVDLAADFVVGVAGNASPRMILMTLFILTAGLGLFISNTATAVLMAPVAIAVAKDLGFSPYPFAMTVALAASCAFMTPVSSPVNTLVVGPAGYSFGDFVKVGVPFTILCMIVTLVLVPILLPL